MTAGPTDLERLHEHRRRWRDKPVLARVYAVWFDAVLAALPPGARVLEVGAGPGFLAEHVRAARPDLRWLASDLLVTPWNGLVGDALSLPLRSGSLDAVVGIDFIHHLAQPARFFEETARVLRPGGQLVAIEPWITPLSFPIYRFLHEERCRWGVDPWNAFADVAAKDAFDGESTLPYALVRRTNADRWRAMRLEAPAVRFLNGFAYLMSLGFKPGCLLPPPAAPAMLALDEVTRVAARWIGMRAQLTWRRLD